MKTSRVESVVAKRFRDRLWGEFAAPAMDQGVDPFDVARLLLDTSIAALGAAAGVNVDERVELATHMFGMVADHLLDKGATKQDLLEAAAMLNKVVGKIDGGLAAQFAERAADA